MRLFTPTNVIAPALVNFMFTWVLYTFALHQNLLTQAVPKGFFAALIVIVVSWCLECTRWDMISKYEDFISWTYILVCASYVSLRCFGTWPSALIAASEIIICMLFMFIFEAVDSDSWLKSVNFIHQLPNKIRKRIAIKKEARRKKAEELSYIRQKNAEMNYERKIDV
jgi:hypothetical protein